MLAPVHAALKTWVASASGNASVAGNWSPAAAPVTGDDVLFNGGGTGACTWNLSVSIGTFTVLPAYTGDGTTTGVIGLQSAGAETFSGAFTISGGTVEFRDTFGPFVLQSSITINGGGKVHIGSATVSVLNNTGPLTVNSGGMLEMHDQALFQSTFVYVAPGGALHLFDNNFNGAPILTSTSTSSFLNIKVDGQVDVSSAVFQRLDPSGFKIGSGAALINFSTVTFAGPLQPGATAVNFYNGGTFVSTFSSVRFADTIMGVNINASSLAVASRITMRYPAAASTFLPMGLPGPRAGPNFQDDPSGLVSWPDLGGCGSSMVVNPNGLNDFTSISGALQAALPQTFSAGNLCVNVAGGTYTEQVNVANFKTNNFRVLISTAGGQVTVSPPAFSTAAFVITSASVTLQALTVRTTSSIPYGVLASSPSVTISSVNVDSGNNITVAGISISSQSSISYSSVTVQGAKGIYSSGNLLSISFSTAASNALNSMALHFNGVTNSTVTTSVFSNPQGHAVRLDAGAGGNVISRSTMTSNSTPKYALDIIAASSNTVTQCYLFNSGNSAIIDTGANNNTISQSTMIASAVGYTAFYVNGSSNVVTQSFMSNINGYGAYLDGSAAYNTISQSTMTSNLYNYMALYVFASYNTVTQSFLSNPSGYVAFLDVSSSYNTISQSTMTSSSNNSAFYLTQGATNTITQDFITNSLSTGAWIDFGTVGNIISFTTITTLGVGRPALYMTGSTGNIVTQSYLGAPNGYAVWLATNSSLNLISQSTMTSASSNGLALYLRAASSNTITQSFLSNPLGQQAAFLDIGSSSNTISQSTMTSNGIGNATLYLKGASSNTVTRCSIFNANGHAAWLDVNANSNLVSQSTITNAGSLAGVFELSNASTNTIDQNTIYSPVGNGIDISAGCASNTVSRSTITTIALSSYGLYMYNSGPNTVNQSYIANPNGIAAYLDTNASFNTISQSTITSFGSPQSALLFNAASSNTVTQSVIMGGGQYGVYITNFSSNNVITQSVITSTGLFNAGATIFGASSNTISQSFVSDPNGNGVIIQSNAANNTLDRSTVTCNSGTAGLFISGASSTTISNSYVQCNNAANVSGSTSTVFNSDVLVATNTFGDGADLFGDNTSVAMATVTIIGTGQGVGVKLFTSINGALSFNAVTFSALNNGVQVSTLGAGGTLAIGGMTFSGMKPGSTGINFLGGLLVSTFSSVNFADTTVAVNVNAASLNPSSRITMLNAVGPRSGPSFASDPSGVVAWTTGAPPPPASLFTNGQNAAAVLGQANFTASASAVTQAGFGGISLGVFADSSGNIWVPDFSNNRVLEFKPPFSSGMNASLVLGQANFTTAASAVTQAGMSGPSGVSVDLSGNVWVVDRTNNRVLKFTPPLSNGMNASLVLGQANFTSSGFATTQAGLNAPFGVFADSSGNVWVGDQGNNRVLEYAGPTGNGQNATLVLGQSNFTTGTSATTQAGMNLPDGVSVDSSGNLWVAEFNNNRVLKFTSPFSNGMNASLVLGQSNFTSNISGLSQTGMFSPAGVSVDSAGNAWVGDGGNSRVLEFIPPFSNGMSASAVLGQPNFTSATTATTQAGMKGVSLGVSVDSSSNVWVADFGNNRVLEFTPSTLPATNPAFSGNFASPSGAIVTGTGLYADNGGVGVAVDAVTSGGPFFNVVLFSTNSPLIFGYPRSSTLVRYDSAGNLVASASLSPANDGNRPIVLDSAGNIYIANSISGGPKWLSKFSPSLALISSVTLSAAIGTDAQLASDGTFLYAAHKGSSFDPPAKIVKYNSNLVQVATAAYQISSFLTQALAIDVSASGSVNVLLSTASLGGGGGATKHLVQYNNTLSGSSVAVDVTFLAGGVAAVVQQGTQLYVAGSTTNSNGGAIVQNFFTGTLASAGASFAVANATGTILSLPILRRTPDGNILLAASFLKAGRESYGAIKFDTGLNVLSSATFSRPSGGIDNVGGAAVLDANTVVLTGASQNFSSSFDAATIKLSLAVPPLPLATCAPKATPVTVTSIHWGLPNPFTNSPTSYNIYTAADPSIRAANVSSPSFDYTGLSTNTAYSVSFAGVNAAGQGQRSISVTAYTLAAPPAGSSASIFLTSATLSWQLNQNPANTRAWIDKSTDSLFRVQSTTLAAVTSLTDSALQACTSYYFRIRNLNGDGWPTAYDNTLAFMTAATTPTAPGAFTAASLPGNKIAFNWSASGPEGITGYNLYYDGGTGIVPSTGTAPFAVLAPSATSFTTGVLVSTAAYSFHLTAANRCGVEEALGAYAAAAAILKPSAIRAAVASPQSGRGSLVAGGPGGSNALTVAASLVSGNPSKVLFQYKPSTAAAWSDIGASAAFPFTVSWDITDPSFVGQNLSLRAVAFDAAGNPDAAPSAVTISVAAAGTPGAAGEINLGGVVTKTLTLDNSVENTIVTSAQGRLTSLTLPPGAVNAPNPTVSVVSNPDPTSFVLPSGFDVSAGIVTKISLGAGQTLLPGATASFTISYPDADNRGFIDGTTLRADSVRLISNTGLPGAGWNQDIVTSVDLNAHTITGFTPHFSFFAIVGTVQTNLDSVRVYPVPYKPNGTDPNEGRPYAAGVAGTGIVFDNLPAVVTIKIYTVSGTLVTQLTSNAGTGALVWDAKNDAGKDVASGGYFAAISTPGFKTLVKRLAIVR